MIHISGRRCVALVVVFLSCTAAFGLIGVPAATAEPGAHIDRIEAVSPGHDRLFVYSAAMGRVIRQDVVHPVDDTPRPTVYVLNGANGGASVHNSWQYATDILDFAADKGANVVVPVGGMASYYTDWQQDDPAIGRQKWTTYLAEELPPLIDRVFHGNGADAIIGSSMSVTAALWLAEREPHRYRAVGAFSGCAETTTPQGIAYVNTVTRTKGADPVNMWGPIGGPEWIEHDALLHADRLRGLTIYLSSGNGILGRYPYDQGITDPVIWNDPDEIVDGLLANSAVEAATSGCTRRLAQRLADLGIPATYRPHEGIHAWGYWQESLHDFWPALSAAVGATPR